MATTPPRHHTHSHSHHSHEHEHSHAAEHHSHGHEHEHSHAADPPHTHAHHHESHPAPAPSQRRLERGEGSGKLLFLSAQSGIAGDMTVASLVDLGVPFEIVQAALSSLQLSGYQARVCHEFAGAVGASRFVVDVDPGQPQRDFAEIRRLLREASLASSVRQLAEQIFHRIAEAEAEVHRTPIDRVHFHEVGAVDSIVDIVAAAACFDFIGAQVSASPLPLGAGTVMCQHGPIPLPAPATLLCLRGVPTYASGLDTELVTPTGAAIVGAVAEHFCTWPSMRPERVGWGKGSRVLPDRLNVLRSVLGTPTQALGSNPGYILVEANVDDLTGELAGHAIEQLMQAGALDAWLTPITMKKGRAGLTVSALGTSEQAKALGELLLRETTTIGYRMSPWTRGERPRRIVSVETPYGQISVKISGGDSAPAQLKPEFDDCARQAKEHGVPAREVIQAALAAARQQL